MKLTTRQLLNNVLMLTPLLGLLITLMYLSNFGIDMTDEGYYLLNAAWADRSLLAVSNFGEYTGLLFSLSGKNVALFRIFGMLLLVLSSSYFVKTLHLYWCNVIKSPLNNNQSLLDYSVFGSSILIYYLYWLPTPSYNWLAFMTCLLTGAAIIHLRVAYSQKHDLLKYCVWAGFCLMLSVMAKPSSALMLGIYALVWISASQLRKQWLVINFYIAGATLFFFALHVLLFEDGFSGFYYQLIHSVEYAGGLKAGLAPSIILERSIHALMGVFTLFKSLPITLIIIGCIGIVNVISLFDKRAFSSYLASFNSASLLAVIVVAWGELQNAGYWVGGEKKGTEVGEAILCLSFVSLISVIIMMLPKIKDIGFNKCFVTLGIIISCIWLMLSFGFGSSNGLLRHSSSAAAFCVCAVMLSVHWWETSCNRRLIYWPVSILLFICSIMILDDAYEHPYRLGSSLAEQTDSVSFLGSSSTIKVTPKTAKYVNELKAIAKAHNWHQKTPLLDLTGASPLSLFILDAEPIKTAWLSGGYPGSNEAAKKLLSGVAQEKVKRAWVLTAPTGVIKLPEQILEAVHLELKVHWEPIGTLNTDFRNEVHILWKPKG